VERKIFDRLRSLALLGNLCFAALDRVRLLRLLGLGRRLLRLLVILLALDIKLGQFGFALCCLLCSPLCEPTRRLFDGERVIFLTGLVGDLTSTGGGSSGSPRLACSSFSAPSC
jgi:hypothetical protein